MNVAPLHPCPEQEAESVVESRWCQQCSGHTGHDSKLQSGCDLCKCLAESLMASLSWWRGLAKRRIGSSGRPRSRPTAYLLGKEEPLGT